MKAWTLFASLTLAVPAPPGQDAEPSAYRKGHSFILFFIFSLFFFPFALLVAYLVRDRRRR